MPPLRTLLAVLAVCALATWPWLGHLHDWPQVQDTAVWMEGSASSSDGWLEYVFTTRHFNVGYRPVTALSFTLNHLVGGFEPFGYRALDLALHLGVGLLVAFLFRKLAPALPAWAALVAMGLFFAHRASEEVALYIARRGYSLSMVLALGGLAVLAAWFERERRPLPWLRACLAGGLLAAGLLANEACAVVIALAPWIVLRRAGLGRAGWTTALRSLAPAGVLLALAAGARALVMRKAVGGYQLQSEHSEIVPKLLAVFVERLAGLDPWRALNPLKAGPLGLAVLVAVGGYYLWRCLAAGRGSAGAALFGLWLLGYAALYTALGVLFERMLYVVAVPYSMLLAAVLGSTWSEFRERPGSLGLHLVPQALPIGALLFVSPLLRGIEPTRAAEIARQNDLTGRVVAAAERCEPDASLELILPVWRSGGFYAGGSELKPHRLVRLTFRWLQLWYRDSKFLIRDAVYLDRRESLTGGRPRLALEGDQPVVILPEGETAWVRVGREFEARPPDADRTYMLEAGKRMETRRRYLFDFTADGDGLLPLDSPR